MLRAHLPRWEGLIHVVERVRRIFDLDADLDAVHRSLRRDQDLAPRLRRHPGLRLPGAWDPFELAVRAVLGQQVSVKGATTLAGRLVERFGVPVPGLEAFGLTHLFPEPATLADATLTGTGLPKTRAATVRGLAQRVLDGSLVFDGSRGLGDTVAGLSAVPGVGPWTANYVAMRACGEPDAFPAADLGIRRALGNGRLLTARQAEERAERWRPWRAYAAVHLWASAP